jgi:hypothetical protein
VAILGFKNALDRNLNANYSRNDQTRQAAKFAANFSKLQTASADFTLFPPSLPSSLRYDATSRFGATSAQQNFFCFRAPRLNLRGRKWL